MKNKYNNFFLNNNYILSIIKIIVLLLLSFIFNVNVIAINDQPSSPQKNKFINKHVTIFLDIDQHNPTLNTIYSPSCIQNSLIIFINVMCGGLAKYMIKQLNDLGIYGCNQMCFSDNSNSLQYITAVLTKNSVTEITKKHLQKLNILLGEQLLYSNLQTDLPEEFKQQFYKLFNAIFNTNKPLENIIFKQLTDTSKNNLKIISTIKFHGDLEYGYFSSIGNKKFITDKNKKIKVEFLFAKVNNTKIICEFGWKAVRLLYKGNYSIDIILPNKANNYSIDKQNKMIYKLIESLSNIANNDYDYTY
jgi:hypothetical protein